LTSWSDCSNHRCSAMRKCLANNPRLRTIRYLNSGSRLPMRRNF